MTFFYHSGLGAVYFFALIAVCAYAMWRGGNARLFASAVLGVFLCDRVLLATTSGQWMMMWGGLAEFGALMLIFTSANTLAARAIMALFAAKIITYIALNLGVISFRTMAAWTELSGYVQLLIILGSASHADRGKLANWYRLAGFHRFGSARSVGSARDVENGIPLKGHSRKSV